MVKERPFGDAGGGDDVIDATALKAVVIELQECRFEDALSGRISVAWGSGTSGRCGSLRRHALMLQTSRYAVKHGGTADAHRRGRGDAEETQRRTEKPRIDGREERPGRRFSNGQALGSVPALPPRFSAAPRPLR